MKYRPEFPDRFGSIQDARAFCRQFFDGYNKGCLQLSFR
jgi:putative transposase